MASDADRAQATLRVTTELPWLVRGWCRALIRPCLRVDGITHEVDWGAPRATSELPVAAGEHRVQFKARFRGTRDVGATSRVLTIRLAEGQTLELLAHVSALSGFPPTLREWTPHDRDSHGAADRDVGHPPP